MQDYLSNVLEAASYIGERTTIKPDIAIILGSGLGGLAEEVNDRVEIPYEEIPHFPVSNVKGHKNQLILGNIYGKNVVVMQGRFHYYEGYDMQEVTFPIKVFAMLGVTKLVVSNAAGGINPKLKAGDLMLITDHINISGLSPLRGENIPELGERFPSMRGVYSARLIEVAKEQLKMIEEEQALAQKEENAKKRKGIFGGGERKQEAENWDSLPQEFLAEYAEEVGNEIKDEKIALKEGVYAFMPGPQYETPAEIKMLSILGADAVGMSTVPEVVSAIHSGMEVLGISCITNECISSVAPSHQEVIRVADRISDSFKNLVSRIIRAM